MDRQWLRLSPSVLKVYKWERAWCPHSNHPSTTTGKNAIVDAEETGTVFLNRFHSPALRALRTEKTTALEKQIDENIMPKFGNAQNLYFGGDMESAIPLSGQVSGRIESIKPVAEILDETRQGFFDTIGRLAKSYN